VYHEAVKNFALARLFSEMATLLEVKNESVFRVRAYQRAAQTLEALAEDVAAVAARGELQKLQGVGRDLAARIEEYLQTGTIQQLEGLRGGLPAKFLTLLEIRGLGPKTAKLLYDKLGVDSVERLEELCRSKEILGGAGIREKTCENILKGIAIWKAGRSRMLLSKARAIALQMAETLQAHGGVERLEIAGSLRRMRETVKDVDILVTSREPARVIRTLVSLPSVIEVIGQGDTKASVRHQDGIQIDLRVVEPEALGAALQYFTGSKDHNVKVREIASRKGLRVSEYGVFEEQSGKRVAGLTEQEVYAAVGLPWIPPELRENTGEIEAARAGRLPALVTAADIRGDLHAHTDWSDGHHPLEKLIETAQARGYEYIIVSDHSKSSTVAGGLAVDELKAQVQKIRELQPRFKIRILTGTECDILADGSMDYPDEILAELDVVIGSIHSGFTQGETAITRRIIAAMRNPHVTLIAHPTGRLMGQREPYPVNLEAVYRAAKDTGTALEINAYPKRLDLCDTAARQAKALGCTLAISTDTHSRDQLDQMVFGLGVARRAWCEPHDLLNCRSLKELLVWIARKRKRASQ